LFSVYAMKVDIHYGKGILSLRIPEKNVERIIRPWQGQSRPARAVLAESLQDDQAEQFKRQIAGKRVCVLTEDGTRDGAGETLFEDILSLLKPASQLIFLICTGTHDAETPENNRIKRQLRSAAESVGLRNYAIHTHDCQQDDFVNAGLTSRGTEVLYNARADEADIFLVFSDMKTHYFAGYSNPVKNFVPGICAFKTAEQNHSLALDDRSTFGIHPWHSDSGRRDNQCAADQLEAMQMIVKDRPVYTFATISTDGKVQWARFGRVRQVTSEGFGKIDEQNTHTVKPVSKLIVSPGGFPNDVSLYIAQRALELSKNAVLDGGEVLFLAACEKGVGEQRTIDNFYNILTAPIAQVLKSIKGGYKMYSHKPYKFAQLIRRLDKIWIHTQISDELVEAAHLHPAHNPQKIVDAWLQQQPDVKITIVDGANRIALYSENNCSFPRQP